MKSYLIPPVFILNNDINNAVIQNKNGIEYGKLGILNCVYFLNKRDNFLMI